MSGNGISDPEHSTEPAYQVWRDQVWYFNKRAGHYYSRGGTLLHRELWAAANGPIPDDHEVHHINRKRWDNRMENLRLLARSEHRSLSAKERTDSWRDHQQPEAVSARMAAYWERRKDQPPRVVTCGLCGADFRSHGMRAKYCPGECQRKAGIIATRNATVRRRAMGKK